MITIAESATGVRNPAYPKSRVRPGAIALLTRTDNWSDLTAHANASPDHVGSLDRWVRKAKEENPKLSDEQAARLGELHKRQHYERMGRLSGESRRRNREAARANEGQ